MLKNVKCARCVKCGKDCEESIDGLCIDCWLDGRRLTSLPHHVDLKVCTNCGEYEFGDRWLKRDRMVAVQDAAADALSVIRDAVPVSVSTEAVEQDPYVYSVTVRTTCDVMGYEADDEETTIVRIKNTVCKRCSRQLGSYYEAILQLRSASGKLDDAMREEALAMTENSVARQAATNRQLFITKMEIVPGGVDVYLSSIALGKSITKELGDAFCAETKESPKLVGQTTDGQDMYRLTYLVRLPDYKVGDVVTFQGGHFLLSRLNGTGGKVVNLTDFRERSVRRSDMTSVKLYERSEDLRDATVISRSGDEIQVLDPSNYSTVDLRVPEGAEVGDTVRGVTVDDVLYYVP